MSFKINLVKSGICSNHDDAIGKELESLEKSNFVPEHNKQFANSNFLKKSTPEVKETSIQEDLINFFKKSNIDIAEKVKESNTLSDLIKFLPVPYQDAINSKLEKACSSKKSDKKACLTTSDDKEKQNENVDLKKKSKISKSWTSEYSEEELQKAKQYKNIINPMHNCEQFNIGLKKAKYIRREGGPGNYKYIYKEGKGPKTSKFKVGDTLDIHVDVGTYGKDFSLKVLGKLKNPYHNIETFALEDGNGNKYRMVAQNHGNWSIDKKIKNGWKTVGTAKKDDVSNKNDPNSLSKEEKKEYDSLIRLGDSPKLALQTIKEKRNK